MEKNLSCSVIAERGLIEVYVAGRLAPSDAERLEAHYLTCHRCQDEIRLALGIRGAVTETRQQDDTPVSALRTGTPEVERARATVRRIKLASAAALAAAAVLAGVLFLRSADLFEPPAAVHREGAAPADATPRLVEPAGETPNVDDFRWTSVPDADLYRVTVYGADGEVLHEGETEDTWLAVSRDVGLQPGETYLWKVEARVGWTRWVSSELVSFVLLEAETPAKQR